MKTITVKASGKYDCLIGNDLISKVGCLIKAHTSSEKVMIITDDKVAFFYLEIVRTSLKNEGYDVYEYIIENGEKSKNAENYIKILNVLANNYFTRSDAMVALGGGVVGDLTGFVAATFLRGIRFFQIPTTLLAMVDSSVGGKTAIDLDAGKNLAGAFYQPKMVIADTDTLDTLDIQVFRDGCAEVIKTAAIADRKLFDYLSETGEAFDREYVIGRCMEIKASVVEADEFDNGKRQLLNLGHTIGHAIEKCSDYEITHGQAVAIGMVMIMNSSSKFDLTADSPEVMREIVEKFGLPVACDFPSEKLYDVMLADKKRKGNSVTLVIPSVIGECTLKKVSIAELKEYLG